MWGIEALQSGQAWKAANEGKFPTDLGSLGGVVTSLPTELGRQLAAGAQALDFIAQLKVGDPASIIGAVVTAIKGIVNSITNAAEQRAINYANARCWYLANARGIRVASKLKAFYGDRGGYFRFPRASVAKDAALPYWDPLGTDDMLPRWLVPYGWTDPSSVIQWPAVGNWLPRDCTNWFNVNLGADCAGAYLYVKGEAVPVPHPTIVAWPWAWPLTCPARIAGLWNKTSNAELEKAVAGLYMLPTPQHIATAAADVAVSKALIKLALLRLYPGAYEAAPGYWLTKGEKRYPTGPWSKNLSTDPKVRGGIVGPDGSPTAAGQTFEAYANALARIQGWEVCRAAILEAPHLLPTELRELLVGNPDFAGADTDKPERVGRKPERVGRDDVEGNDGGGEVVILAAAGLGLLWLAL